MCFEVQGGDYQSWAQGNLFSSANMAQNLLKLLNLNLNFTIFSASSQKGCLILLMEKNLGVPEMYKNPVMG